MFRRAAAARAAEEAARVAAVQAAAGQKPGDQERQPWIAAGVSKATWYRRKARETEDGTLRDLNQGDRDKAVDESGSGLPGFRRI